MNLTLNLSEKYEGMDKQLDFIVNDKFQSALYGGFGNAKTTSLCDRAVVLSMKYPKALGVIGRATYPELRDSTIRSFFDNCPPELIADYQKQENKVTMKNGAEIVFRAFDDPRKILSMNLGWIGVDQLEEISEELYLQMLGRLRSPHCRYFFGVGNPEPGWVKKTFKDTQGKDKDILLVEATSLENPHLPKDYVDNLLRTYPKHWVDRYVYGSWNFFEGMVFTEYRESRDIINPFEIPATWRHEFVIDYGYRNPFCCLEIVIDHDDNYYVINEHYEREQTISYHVDKMLAMGITRHPYIDPSAGAKNRTMKRADGTMIQCSIIDEIVEQSNNRILPLPADNNVAGIMRTNEYFKEGRLKIFKNCEHTKAEIETYRWKKVKPNWDQNIPEEMEDKDNHAIDCIKYFVNSRPRSNPKAKTAAQIAWEHRQKKLFSIKDKTGL